MKKIYLILLISLLSIAIYAQEDDFGWAKSMGGTYTDYGYFITTDASGNIYTTGMFENTVDFDPGEATFELTSNGMFDIFVQKLDADGNFIWAKSIGGTRGDNGRSMTIDASGNVYITGSFEEVVDFDPGETIFNLTSIGTVDIYILKLDASGNFIWAKAIGSTYWDFGLSITLDALGNVCITGGFSISADFDPGEGTFNLTSNGQTDVFVMKLTSNGDFIWAKAFGGIYEEQCRTIITDAADNLYLNGFFKTTVDFDPGAATYNLTSNGGYDCFTQKLDTDGNFIWVKTTGGSSNDFGESMTKDASGNFYITGFFEGAVDFDPGAGNLVLISNGLRDIFIQKLDADGNLVWAKTIGGAGNDHGNTIATDPSGNVYAAGSYRGTVDFDPSDETFNLTSNGFDDIFIQKLGAGGHFIWAKSIGGTDVDEANSIKIDNSGNIYTTGNFVGTADFNPNAATFDLTSNGSKDIFILKLNPDALGIEENNFINSLYIFPNPATDEIFISNKSGSTINEIIIYNQLGQNVLHQVGINNAIDVSMLQSGIYIIEVISGNSIKREKIIIE